VLIAQYQSELEERQTFIDQILDQAVGRDLNEHEVELVGSASGRMAVLNQLVEPLRETARISTQSRNRMAEIQRDLAVARDPRATERPQIEYRSAGAYIVDRWQAQVGMEDARQRIDLFHRAAAHQTTPDNLGIIPNPVVGEVLNFIDVSRPIVSVLGTLAVPGGRFARPRVTQHTQVGEQTAEKTELVSRKMLIDSTPVDMSTYGGYVNVSRQNIDWSVPQIMDLVVNDLAGQYAIQTEGVAASTLVAGATAPGTPITPGSSADEIAAALWAGVAAVYSAMPGAGRVVLIVSPDMLAAFGGLFAPYGATNSQGQGFSAGAFASGGPVGVISGVPVYMSASLPNGTAILVNTSAAEVYEQRIGTLSVTEPSVLGVQVAYAGYFAAIVLVAGGVQKLTA
jgi:HK97 family phage major capsid protein